MTHSSLSKNAYKKIIKISIIYALSLVISVLFISFFYLKSSILREKGDSISSVLNSISDSLINENYPLILQEIQQKTHLQEVILFDSNCNILATSTLFASKEKCVGNDSSFHKLEKIMNSRPIKVFFKSNINLHQFTMQNKQSVFLIFFAFFTLTITILILFLKDAVIQPLQELENQLKRNESPSFPLELDYIGAKLLQLKEDIEKVEKDRTYFSLARRVVHDIRNPLEYLKIMSDQTQLSQENVKIKINEIDYQIKKLLQPGSKNTIFNYNLCKLLLEIKNDLSLLFNLSIYITCEVGLIETNVNENDLKNILGNLAKNSFEAGATEFKIKVGINNSSISFDVEDNGHGIDENFQNKIFTLNFTTKKNGNGIGLNSLQRFLSAYNGNLKLISSNEITTRFLIEISAQQSFEQFILIDDDKFIRQAWEASAKKNGLDFLSFPSIESFLQQDIPINNSKIYIDSDLGNSIKGESESYRVFKAGYKNIYIATSFTDINIKDYPWIKGIKDKTPPF